MMFLARPWTGIQDQKLPKHVTEGEHLVLNSSCYWKQVNWVQNGSNNYGLTWELSLWVLQLYAGDHGITVIQSGKHEGRISEWFCRIDG